MQPGESGGTQSEKPAEQREQHEREVKNQDGVGRDPLKHSSYFESAPRSQYEPWHRVAKRTSAAAYAEALMRTGTRLRPQGRSNLS